MTEPVPAPWRIFVTIFVGLGWLVAIALWLIFYASSLDILQNIGIFILSIAIVAIICVLLWVPWAFKHGKI